jgi:hypothetical protein
MMSATEWLQFINPFMVIAIILTLMASIPVASSWIKPFKLSDKPFALKKILISAIIFTALGWILAYLAPHVMTPIVRVNMVAISQVISIFSLLAICMVLINRISKKNNLLSMLFILAKHSLLIIITIIGKVCHTCLLIFLDASKNAKRTQERFDQESEPYKDPKGSINYQGDYCDKYKSNWY